MGTKYFFLGVKYTDRNILSRSLYLQVAVQNRFRLIYRSFTTRVEHFQGLVTVDEQVVTRRLSPRVCVCVWWCQKENLKPLTSLTSSVKIEKFYKNNDDVVHKCYK